MPRDRALLVGINVYQNFQHLDGCRQDAEDMKSLVTGTFGFDQGGVVTLFDEEAIKDRISEQMEWLYDGAGSGDRLLFHFSGHGSFNSPDGDPPDGVVDGLVVDGIICLHDFQFGQSNTYFTDDELRSWTVRKPKGAELVVVLDSCHSGGGPAR